MQKLSFLCGILFYLVMPCYVIFLPIQSMLLLWVRPDQIRYYNFAFTIPIIVFDLAMLCSWKRLSVWMGLQYVVLIQAWAFTSAIKDRLLYLFLKEPSATDRDESRYRNARFAAWVWMLGTLSLLFAGVEYRVLTGLPWYDVLPLMILAALQFCQAHRFLRCPGKGAC